MKLFLLVASVNLDFVKFGFYSREGVLWWRENAGAKDLPNDRSDGSPGLGGRSGWQQPRVRQTIPQVSRVSHMTRRAFSCQAMLREYFGTVPY